MSGDGTISFATEDIAGISSQTMSHQQEWDSIWEGVRKNLGQAAADALGALPGGSLDHRTAEYHRKTTTYNSALQAQSGAVAKVGSTASDYNQAMTKTIAG